MIVTGRCRGNGAQLADYWMHSPENERAQVLGIFGTATPNNLKWSLTEMSLTSELSDRTDAGLYHGQISPRAHEAANMTHEQKIRAGEILAENLGLAGQKWAISEQVIEGRLHFHVAYERYNHETGLMWLDDNNYEKHMAAARQMEREFEHQLTHEQKNHLDQDIKGHILNLWNKYQEPADFVKAMDNAGFEVTQGTERPWQMVDQYGTVHNLTKQLAGFKQADVSERLNPYRKELRPSPEVSKERRREYQSRQLQAEFEKVQDAAVKQVKDFKSKEKDQQQEPIQSDNNRELSDSQDRVKALKSHYQKTANDNEAPSLPHQPEEKNQSDNLSDKQTTGEAMLKAYRQKQADRQEQQRKAKEMRQQAAEQTKKQQQEKSVTDQAAEMLERYRQRQQERGQDRSGPEY